MGCLNEPKQPAAAQRIVLQIKQACIVSIPRSLNGRQVLLIRVVFKALESGPLPVTFTSIKAAQQNNKIAVEWKVGSQLNIARYEVETSVDGRDFVKVAGIDAGTTTTYNWLDVNAVQGVNFYLLRAIDNNATFKYTQIVKITLGSKGASISVSPNPVKGNIVTLQLANQEAGKYKVNLTNAAGQLMYGNNFVARRR